MPVQFDKPDGLLQLGKVFGPGIRFNAAGGVVAIADGPAAVASGGAGSRANAADADAAAAAAAGLGGGGGVEAAAVPSLPPSALFALPPETRERLRSYALLLHVLHGRPVGDMARLRSGAWELERMGEQLGSVASPATAPQHADSSSAATSHAAAVGIAASGKAARVADLVYWRKARDPASGRVYWWNTASFATQWQTPMVDGAGPYEWHPHLTSRDEPIPEGSAGQARK